MRKYIAGGFVLIGNSSFFSELEGAMRGKNQPLDNHRCTSFVSVVLLALDSVLGARDESRVFQTFKFSKKKRK